MRWRWLVLAVAAVSSTAAFNLEPRLAIVKRGRPGSYFGYSVAQHQIVGSDRQGADTTSSENLVSKFFALKIM